MSIVRFLFVTALATLVAHAAEVRDLGEGLSYLRLRDVDGEAFSVPAGPLVVDLRQATQAGSGGIDRLRGLLGLSGVRFVLVSEATAPAITAFLETRAPTVLTIGSLGAPETDIRVSVSTEDDRKAFEALEQGTSLADLVTPPLVKARRDEAAILRARRAGNRPPDGPPPPAVPTTPATPTPPAAPATAEAPTVPPVSDPVLQRAVQLHRGLRALKRL
ncbi:MAG TPA: hypothetical protein VGD88_06405 [Opitutaceae bacterium]